MALMGKSDKDVHATLNNFTFSAIDVDQLEESQYTLVNILVDLSSSVSSFKNELEKTLSTIVESCQKSPQSQTLLLRVAGFTDRAQNDCVDEIHGFISLGSIATNQYVGSLNPSGMTPLFDAMGNALETIETYGKQLAAQDYFCNGIFFVITDGFENASRKLKSASAIKSTLERIRKDEALESIRAILIGVDDSNVQSELTKLKDDAGFDEYLSLGDVSAKKLAKLANWISQSVSSQSQSLGSGGPSQPVNFAL